MKTAIIWFRQDLRLHDNPALLAAVNQGFAVIPVYIWTDYIGTEENGWPLGGASKWWLHYSLKALSARLEENNSSLVLRSGDPTICLRELVKESGAEKIFWNRCYEPAIIKRDTAVKEQLKKIGLEVESFNSALLFEPWEVSTKQKTPYKVFTPFMRACLDKMPQLEIAKAPKKIPRPERFPISAKLDSFSLEPKIDWAAGFDEVWTPGEEGALKQLKKFVGSALSDYNQGRDLPGKTGTSRLSPHLHFGEISPRLVWQETLKIEHAGGHGGEVYRRELIWREFSYHLLFHFPESPTKPLRAEFANFPWKKNAERLSAWQKGRTGYPIVDAGMRELWRRGWMHNRVRMIVASFLVKDLLIPWQTGARWFWDTLVDADLANNTLGWQWTAGCGADAAPFFRIFNPTLQGEKFDKQGDYVKAWCPELAKLPPKYIHRPWEAPDEILKKAGVILGKDYPNPIVDHADARDEALEAYEELKADKLKS